MKFFEKLGIVLSYLIVIGMIICAVFVVITMVWYSIQSSHEQSHQNYEATHATRQIHRQYKMKHIKGIIIKHNPTIKRFYKQNDMAQSSNTHKQIAQMQKSVKQEAIDYKKHIRNKSEYKIYILPVHTHTIINHDDGYNGTPVATQDTYCDTAVLVLNKTNVNKLLYGKNY